MKKFHLLICLPLFIATCAFCEETASKSSARPAAASPAAPITRSLRLCAAHHSYFVQVPPILTEIAKAAGFAEQAWIGTKYIGGSKSIQHWNLKDEDNKAKDALKTTSHISIKP